VLRKRVQLSLRSSLLCLDQQQNSRPERQQDSEKVDGSCFNVRNSLVFVFIVHVCSESTNSLTNEEELTHIQMSIFFPKDSCQ
jgi:hypothetical protein